jgi:hypothetical protein
MKQSICIPLHPDGGKFRDNTELRHALRSLCRHFKDEFEVVIVAEKLPPWLTGVRHIRGAGLKDSLHAAADACPEGFFWFYDDTCLVRDTTGAEMRVTPCCKGWSAAKTSWARMLAQIHQRLTAEGVHAWDYSRPHGPYWFTKAMVDEGFADWPKMTAKFPWESWILSKRDWPRRHGVVRQYYGEFKAGGLENAWFVNYNDKGCSAGLLTMLESLFPDPCEFEIPAGTLTQGSAVVVSPAPGKAISFCLYGQAAKYGAGMVENARLAKEVYPGWEVVVHCEQGHYARAKLAALGARVIEHPAEDGHRGMFWRFETADMPQYERVVFRDADSRLNPRERAAVDAWEASGAALHVMRDHPHHRKPIMGGMFGVRTGSVDFRAARRDWPGSGAYGDDEAFLAARIWPVLRADALVHTSLGGEVDFPPHAPCDGHVGERVALAMPADTRLVLLSPERYAKRRERCLESIAARGGFLNRLDLEWWKATPSEQLLPPPSFHQVRKVRHWWAATCDHLRIMEETLLSKHEYLFLLEDDAVLHPDFEELFWRAWATLPKDWKAMRLGWHEMGGTVPVCPGVLDRCGRQGGLMIANLWNRTGLHRAYDHFWHRRKMIIDMAFQDLRKLEPRDWYQPAKMLVTKDPLAKQRGGDC